MNEILHSLCNRSSGWDSPAFVDVPGFVPQAPNLMLDTLRGAAGLDASGSGYHLVGALGVIEACPDVKQAFGERGRVYDVSRYVRPRDQFTGGALRGNRHGAMAVNRIPSEWPIRRDITLTILSETGTKLEYGPHNIVVPSTYGNGFLSLEWPSDTGINGRVEISSGSPGVTFSIWHEPTHFPVEVMLSYLESIAYFHTLMGTSGLAAAYRQAYDPVQKAALFYLALGRANKAVYP